MFCAFWEEGAQKRLTGGLQGFGDLPQGEAHLQQRHGDGGRRGRRRQPAAGVRQSWNKHHPLLVNSLQNLG